MPQLPKKALLERLFSEGKLSREQYQAVRAHAEKNDTRYEDAIVETGSLDEPVLLKWLAALYKTRFVSTEKLSKAEINRATLQMIPRPMADKFQVFPVVFDPSDKSLAFVLADPDNVEIVQQVQMHANVASVKPYVARPNAIKAAIQKHYHGDIHAFDKVDQKSYQEFQSMMETYERNVIDESALEARSATGLRGATIAQESPMMRSGATLVQDGPAATLRGPTIAHEAPASLRGATIVQEGGPPTMRGRVLPPREASFERTFEEELSRNSIPIAAPANRQGAPARKLPPAVSAPQGVSYASAHELVNVLVSLLENQRQELRGHSAQVSRLMHKVAEHMQLDPADVYGMRLCGLIHDVGKVSSYHLTALNVSEYEGHRAQAKKCFMSPVRLFEAASLPKACIDGLASVYERFDGQGFPDRRAGKDIPLAARLLAIAETYADLTSNARNPFRKTLTAKAAVEVLGRYKDKIFDGNLVDLFRVAALSDDMQSSLLNDRPRILLVDADAEETTVLELRLVEQGHEVVLCRTAEQAYKRFQQGGIDAVITEVDLKPHDGFTLVEYVRKHRSGGDLPILFLTRLSDRASVDRGLSLGALDYVIKPAAPDVVVAKLRSVLAKSAAQRVSARGVSGSLREMPLPDVLQVLARTRKTGLLRVSAGGHSGEIQFANGLVYNASFHGLHNEEALYAMLALQDGEFALDPTFVPSSRAMHESTEHLLLEGMRRIDESSVGDEAPSDFYSTKVDER